MIFIRSPFLIIFTILISVFPGWYFCMCLCVIFQNKSWFSTVLWLKHCAVVVLRMWSDWQCSLHAYHPALTAVGFPWLLFLLCLCPPLFRVGRQKGAKRTSGITNLPAQYFVLRFVVQLFTFRLLTFLSLVTEITPGLCPGGMKKKECSSAGVLCMALGGLVFRDPRRMALLVGRSWSSYWQNPEACLLPP